jgi:hypothetical protein
MPDLTPRWVLQYWGTEVVRKGFHDDTWIASLENKLSKTTDDVVISDCRFPNEIVAIKQAGGMVIRVHRGADPEWYSLAEIANSGPHNLKWTTSKFALEKYDIHASEIAWIGTRFDAIIDNNGTMDHLYTQVNDLVQDLLAARANPV